MSGCTKALKTFQLLQTLNKDLKAGKTYTIEYMGLDPVSYEKISEIKVDTYDDASKKFYDKLSMTKMVEFQKRKIIIDVDFGKHTWLLTTPCPVAITFTIDDPFRPIKKTLNFCVILPGEEKKSESGPAAQKP